MYGHKCILITGGCGAIGSVLVNVLKQTYPNTRFVNLDALTYCGRQENIAPPFHNYKLYHGDICDAPLVSHILNTEQPTVIIHLAAETHVDASFGNSMKFTQTNVMGTHTLLECAREYGKLCMFLHMSTDEVYGAIKEGSVDENAKFAPSNPYAATKVGAEMLCHAYRESFGMPIIITRCNNVLSVFQHVEKLIPHCVDRIQKGERIQVHGYGTALRTFIDARDICTALDTIIHSGCRVSDKTWIYNIGTTAGHEYSVLQVVTETLNLMKNNGQQQSEPAHLEDWVKFVPDRPFQDYRYSIDSSELRRLGWMEKYSFTDSLKHIIQHVALKQ